MVLLRICSLAWMVGLLASCMEQYNPFPFWKKIEDERQMAARDLPTP